MLQLEDLLTTLMAAKQGTDDIVALTAGDETELPGLSVATRTHITTCSPYTGIDMSTLCRPLMIFVAAASPIYLDEEEDLTLVHLVTTRTAQAQTTQKVHMYPSITL